MNALPRISVSGIEEGRSLQITDYDKTPAVAKYECRTPENCMLCNVVLKAVLHLQNTNLKDCSFRGLLRFELSPFELSPGTTTPILTRRGEKVNLILRVTLQGLYSKQSKLGFRSHCFITINLITIVIIASY